MGQALMEIMVDELASHLYLKTSYSETRWAVYEPGQTESESPVVDLGSS